MRQRKTRSWMLSYIPSTLRGKTYRVFQDVMVKRQRDRLRRNNYERFGGMFSVMWVINHRPVNSLAVLAQTRREAKEVF